MAYWYYSYLIMLNIRPYEQSAGGYCGPACLKMVLGYFGIRKSERALIALTGATSKDGVGAAGLLKAAKALGFTGFMKDSATFVDIRNYVLRKKIPIIVDWFSEDEGHYSVIMDINEGRIVFADPEFGRRRTMPLAVFRRVWFDYVPNVPKKKSDFVIRRMVAIFPSRQGNKSVLRSPR